MLVFITFLNFVIFVLQFDIFSLYTFDMRKLGMPINVHMDHVSAVLDVEYSPTGKEFVSGSFDKTLRIFPADQGRSRYSFSQFKHISIILKFKPKLMR